MKSSKIGDWTTLSDREQLEFIIYQVKTPIPYNPLDDLTQWESIVAWLKTFELSGGAVYGDYQLDWEELPKQLKRVHSEEGWYDLSPKEQWLVIADYWEDHIENRKLREKPGRKPKTKGDKDKARGVYRYNPDTGRIYRTDAPDMIVEYIDNKCWNVWIGQRISSHRFAVETMTGKIEKRDRIIHVNGDRFDNRWVNLKVIPPYLKHDRIYTRFRFEGELINLGYVDTLEARSKRIEHYRGLRSIGVDHEAAVKAAKDIVK